MNLTETRKRFPNSQHVLLDRLVSIIDVLSQMTRAGSPLPNTKNPVEFYNAYIDFAVALYMVKFRELYAAVASSLETESYLIYASAGRAILENAATLRYYANHKDLTDAVTAWKLHSMKDRILRRANATLDRFVRGTRFTWEEFLDGKFDALGGIGAEEPRSQTNVTTCLEKWYKEKQQYRAIYALFCDLVHPNMGSNMLVLRSVDGKIVAAGTAGVETCLFVILPTLAGLTGAYNTVQVALRQLEEHRLHPIGA